MKKIITVFLTLIITMNSIYVGYAEYNPNPLSLSEEKYEKIIASEYKHSVLALSQLNIVRNPFEKWSSQDFIKRRNAFEMAYTIFTYGSTYLCPKSEIQHYENDILKENRICYDVDLGTYDNALLYALQLKTSLFMGVDNENNQCFAKFDENLTYNEAFIIILRLFNREVTYKHKIDRMLNEKEDPYAYYDLMSNIGLINSNTVLNYTSLTVKKDDINNFITAYEFMNLLYNSLYVPHFASSGYGTSIEGFRYIDSLEWYERSNEITEESYYIP